MSTSPFALAKRYWVTDVPGAQMSGSRLTNALESIAKGQPLGDSDRSYLINSGLHALVEFACATLSEEQFNQRAQTEREIRMTEGAARRKAEQERMMAEQKRAEAERIRRQNINKKTRELRRKYGVDTFVEEEHFGRLMSILRKLDARSRLPELDTIWLNTEGRDYHSDEILHAHHRLEADFYLAEFKRTNDPWQAVNASSHLRKCEASRVAHELLAAIPEERLKQPKLKSAARTTHGGALRDLGRYTEALRLGEEAHALRPDDFMACTLLGAIHMEMGEISLGHEWYRKAEERGATTDSIERELRSMLSRMSAEKREEAVSELLRIDPARYGWLRRKPAGKPHSRG